MKGTKRLFLVFALIAALIIQLSRCMESKDGVAVKGAFAGSLSCRQCHQRIYDVYLHNAHYKTSQPVSARNLLHGLSPDSDVFTFNKHLKIKVETRDSGIFQVAYLDGKETEARRFDLAIGSGEKAYTYGTWQGTDLTQLPLSFFRSVHNWANSPGFPSDKAYFERPIGSRCLECHSSFIDQKTVQTGTLKVTEVLDRKSLIYGIDCERCHGPAGKHVEFHLENPEEKQAKFITLYKSLTRKQKMDACALCHSGNDIELQKSAFGFKPGDDLADYYAPHAGSFAADEPDVHGNQAQLLMGSKCFAGSKDMTCASCHNIHEDIKGNLTIYSQRCMSCHKTLKHSRETEAKGMLKNNCIDCHMPLQPSKLITFLAAGKSQVMPYLLHTHRIGIYAASESVKIQALKSNLIPVKR